MALKLTICSRSEADLLRDVSDDAMSQRVHRIPDLVRKGRDPSRSLADVLVDLMEEMNA
jgi:hypothetical protein